MLCGHCHKKPAEQRHHLYSQTKWARRVYGDLLDDPRNILLVCSDCHLSKPIKKFTEYEFCRALGIPPRSKTELARKKKVHIKHYGTPCERHWRENETQV